MGVKVNTTLIPRGTIDDKKCQSWVGVTFSKLLSLGLVGRSRELGRGGGGSGLGWSMDDGADDMGGCGRGWQGD